MSDSLKKSLVSAGAEALRVMVLAVIPVAIEMFTADKFDYKTLIVVGVVALLRFIDKLLHKYGKETDNEALVTGITRF